MRISKNKTTIIAVFADDSVVMIKPIGLDTRHGETRQRYSYHVVDGDSRTIDSGDDLYSAVNADIDLMKTLSAWTSFAMADAETYTASMSGTPFQEWAYMHDDELSGLSADLEDYVH
jgi:hypothetical protein